MNEVITLIGETTQVNSVGDRIKIQTRRDVFCKIKSVGASYKLQAIAVGLYPKFRFALADVLEYQDEERLEYKGKEYRIIDTYQTEDLSLELTAAEV